MALAPNQSILSAPEGVPLLLRDLVHERIGIYFEAERTDLLLDKLRDRAEQLGCRSYLDYYYILKYDEARAEEWLRVMDAFSVQETYFWREYAQVDAFVRRVVPAWFAQHDAPLRVWSAACASGEEPYSLVIALHEAGLADRPIEIYGSDASLAAITRARAGLYRERSFRALPENLRQKYFKLHSDGWQLDQRIIDRVQFRRANLVNPAEIDLLARASVIFCRNVFIYFSTDSIRRTVASFAERMLPPAYLFVGSSESLLKLTDDFELEEILDAFVYHRKARA